MSNVSVDVVVVGGGVMGLCIAAGLRNRGAGSVTLLERRFLGAGSSGKSGAILRQHYSHRTTIRMARASLQEFATFRERTGDDIGFVRTGMLFIASPADRDSLASNVRLQQSEGVRTAVLDPEELRQLEPRGRFDNVVAAWEPEAGHVDPVRTVGAFGAQARRCGVDVRLGCEVEAITFENTTSGRRITGVRTAGGTIATRRVVAAAGPWSSRLLAPIGIHLPLSIVRPQQAFLRPPTAFGAQHTIVADLPNEVYFKGEAAATRVGSISYDEDERIQDPDDYDESVSNAFLRDARARVARRLPAFDDAILWGGGSGLYTVTPDAHAVIGPLHAIDGLFVVTGFSGHGFKLSPAVGQAVAEWIVEGQARTFDLSMFDPHRFERHETVDSRYRFKILG